MRARARCSALFTAATDRPYDVGSYLTVWPNLMLNLLIAIALGRDAKVLVMDEPAANLDPEARKIFFDLLAERLQDPAHGGEGGLVGDEQQPEQLSELLKGKPDFPSRHLQFHRYFRATCCRRWG